MVTLRRIGITIRFFLSLITIIIVTSPIIPGITEFELTIVTILITKLMCPFVSAGFRESI